MYTHKDLYTYTYGQLAAERLLTERLVEARVTLGVGVKVYIHKYIYLWIYTFTMVAKDEILKRSSFLCICMSTYLYT